jgi:hypothetical protein
MNCLRVGQETPTYSAASLPESHTAAGDGSELGAVVLLSYAAIVELRRPPNVRSDVCRDARSGGASPADASWCRERVGIVGPVVAVVTVVMGTLAGVDDRSA